MIEQTEGTGMAGGRPTDYREEYAEQARKLCMLGTTNDELADFFEVAVSTIHAWRNRFTEFSDALKAGKITADAEVASKLFHRATGYEHPEDDIRAVNGVITITPTVKHYPPDTTAAIFWLKNRQPALWREKREDPGDNTPVEPVRVIIQVEDASNREG